MALFAIHKKILKMEMPAPKICCGKFKNAESISIISRWSLFDSNIF